MTPTNTSAATLDRRPLQFTRLAQHIATSSAWENSILVSWPLSIVHPTTNLLELHPPGGRRGRRPRSRGTALPSVFVGRAPSPAFGPRPELFLTDGSRALSDPLYLETPHSQLHVWKAR